MSDIFQTFIDRDKVIKAYPTMLVDEIMTEFDYQKEQYIVKRLLELDIDKDVLIKQTEEISRLRNIAENSYEQGRADAIEPIEEFVRECKINKATDKPCDECKYSHHSHHQTCLEYVLEQLKENKND